MKLPFYCKIGRRLNREDRKSDFRIMCSFLKELNKYGHNVGMFMDSILNRKESW